MVVRIFMVQAKKPTTPTDIAAQLEEHRQRMKTDPAYRKRILAKAKAADDMLAERVQNSERRFDMLNRGCLHWRA